MRTGLATTAPPEVLALAKRLAAGPYDGPTLDRYCDLVRSWVELDRELLALVRAPGRQN